MVGLGNLPPCSVRRHLSNLLSAGLTQALRAPWVRVSLYAPPANSEFLLVAGRCLSSDREANSALRVACPCMAMGQAAGAMAALAARAGMDPERLPMDDVRGLLRDHGAIVPGDETSQAEPEGPGESQ